MAATVQVAFFIIDLLDGFVTMAAVVQDFAIPIVRLPDLM
jgi:hypothetical protein